MPARRFPRVGARVTVVYLSAQIGGVVEQFDEARRRILVVTDDGDALTFTLNRATGLFHAEGQSSTGARLRFDNAPDD